MSLSLKLDRFLSGQNVCNLYNSFLHYANFLHLHPLEMKFKIGTSEL